MQKNLLKNAVFLVEQSPLFLTTKKKIYESWRQRNHESFAFEFFISCIHSHSDLLHLTQEMVQNLQIPEDQMDKYFIGLDLIEYHQSELNSLGSVRSIKHHKAKSNFWTWLSVATIAAAAVIICIVVPEVAPSVIGGAVELGKTVLGK